MGPTLNFLAAAFLSSQTQMVIAPGATTPEPSPQVQQFMPAPLQQAQVIPAGQSLPPAPGGACPCQNKGGVVMQSSPPPAKASGFRLFGNSAKRTEVIETAPPEIQQTGGATSDRPILNGLRKIFSPSASSSSRARQDVMPTPTETYNQNDGAVYSTSTGGYLKRMPNGIEPAMLPPQQVVPATNLPNAPTSKVAPISYTATATSALNPKLASKVGWEADYSWITGQIQVVGPNSYVIHYAGNGAVERFSGRLPLIVDGLNLSNIQDGDLVSVRGGLVNQSGQTALYRANSIDMIERP